MKKLLTLILLLVTFTIFSQNVTVSIENLKVDGTTLPNNSPIDLGTNSSVNITMKVDLSKDVSYTIGPATVYIDVFDSSGDRTEKRVAGVPESQFSTGASANFQFNIYDDDINFGNGNYLIATLKQNNQPGAEWDSSQIPIIKTPSFVLEPDSLSLACGDMTSKIFQVTNSSNLSGVSYQWNIGNGWSGSVNNSSSITLTPIGGTVLPSDISVTPIYNGVSQPTLTCNVSRASFTTSATINGSNVLCQTSTYTVNNLPNGVTIESASSSNTSVATVNLETNGNITVTKVSNGTITLSVVLENACSQTVTKTKFIQAGENANIDITGLENGIVAGGSANISLTNSNGCGEIYFTDASSGLTFDYVGSDYATLSSTSSNSGTGWVYISITGGTSIYREFPINTTPPPVIPDENRISIARIPSDYMFYPFTKWVKAYYYGNSSDVDYWEWSVGSSYYEKPNDTSIIFLSSSSSNITVNVRACNSNGCSQYASTVIN